MYKHSISVCVWCIAVISILGVPGAVCAEDDDVSPDTATSAEPLAAFVDVILAAHPVIESAGAAIMAAEAQERSADRPIYNPEFGFDIEDAEEKTYELGLFQSVDWSGKKKAAHAASSANRLAVERSYLVTRNSVAAEVLQLLAGYWSAVEFQRLASSTEVLMADFAQQAKLRYDAGDMTQVEYETAVLAYAEVRMRQADVAANLASVIRELTTFGAREDVPTWPRMPSTLPALSTKPGDVSPLLAQLPEIEAANAMVAAADAEVELAKRLKKPDPTLGLRVGEEGDERLIGFTFSIPLFVRNSFNEDLLASIALRSQASADAAEVERDAKARLLVAMERYMTMRQGWVVWEQSGASSIERRAAALQKLWDAREINLSDFLLQVRQTLETRSTALQLRQMLWESWVDYLEASNQVERWLHGSEPIPAGIGPDQDKV